MPRSSDCTLSPMLPEKSSRLRYIGFGQLENLETVKLKQILRYRSLGIQLLRPRISNITRSEKQIDFQM